MAKSVTANEKPINKKELVDLVAERNAKFSKADIRGLLDDIVSVIQEQTTQGNEIVLVGFGAFKQKSVVAREGRNPKTGETIQIPAHTQVVAKLSPVWARLS